MDILTISIDFFKTGTQDDLLFSKQGLKMTSCFWLTLYIFHLPSFFKNDAASLRPRAPFASTLHWYLGKKLSERDQQPGLSLSKPARRIQQLGLRLTKLPGLGVAVFGSQQAPAVHPLMPAFGDHHFR